MSEKRRTLSKGVGTIGGRRRPAVQVGAGEQERSAAANPEWQTGRPWTDTLAPPSTDVLDVPDLAVHPIGTPCRAELSRIGHALHAANLEEDFVELQVEIAEMDPSHAGRRAIVLEMAWAGIRGPVA